MAAKKKAEKKAKVTVNSLVDRIVKERNDRIDNDKQKRIKAAENLIKFLGELPEGYAYSDIASISEVNGGHDAYDWQDYGVEFSILNRDNVESMIIFVYEASESKTETMEFCLAADGRDDNIFCGFEVAVSEELRQSIAQYLADEIE
jgi:hypothetical protein